jgi:hypothetical protein
MESNGVDIMRDRRLVALNGRGIGCGTCRAEASLGTMEYRSSEGVHEK